MTSTRAPTLPTELLHEILIQVLVDSIHLAVVVQEMGSWNVRVHHTLSAVCSSFRDIMHGISCKAFEYKPDLGASKADGEAPSAEEPPSLASHVQRIMLILRTLGASIRHPPGTLAIPSYATGSPRIVQAYYLYAAIVDLRCKAARTTPDIYNSTSTTLSGAILTLSIQLCVIRPRALGAVLYGATQAEETLQETSVQVVQICTKLDKCLKTLETLQKREGAADLDLERWTRRKDLKIVLLAALLQPLAILQTVFRVLMEYGHLGQLPACSLAWLGELPGVWGTISRVNALLAPRPRQDGPSAPWVTLTPEAMHDLELLVAAWRPDTATSAGPALSS
ncbi:hypothetical protein MKEN_00945700 [Mycena kentingensis (nom. inval.)]|nr:hypothetical protein MKEN_00945700 [Mycena kentingensis (nom. inval.)]